LTSVTKKSGGKGRAFEKKFPMAPGQGGKGALTAKNDISKAGVGHTGRVWQKKQRNGEEVKNTLFEGGGWEKKREKKTRKFGALPPKMGGNKHTCQF